jgi:hypothetical protein
MVALKHLEIERKHLLKDVQAANQRLADVFQNEPAFMAVLRGPEHVFEMINCFLRWWATARLIGLPVRQALLIWLAKGFTSGWTGCFATGEPFVPESIWR